MISEPTDREDFQEDVFSKAKIVIADDDTVTRKLIEKILTGDDYDVKLAEDGQQALQLIQENHPDLALLDVMMPGLTGYEVCRQMKADPSTTDIPVIFLTSKTGLVDIAEGFEAGAVDYVSKPPRPFELLARVRTHVELKTTRDSLQEHVARLKESIEEIKALSGMLPICSNCKNIRDDQGYWQQVESYISSRSEAVFSHGMCPDCIKELYPQYAKKEDPDRDES